jgi:hypothetical protein
MSASMAAFTTDLATTGMAIAAAAGKGVTLSITATSPMSMSTGFITPTMKESTGGLTATGRAMSADARRWRQHRVRDASRSVAKSGHAPPLPHARTSRLDPAIKRLLALMLTDRVRSTCTRSPIRALPRTAARPGARKVGLRAKKALAPTSTINELADARGQQRPLTRRLRPCRALGVPGTHSACYGDERRQGLSLDRTRPQSRYALFGRW